MSKIDNFFRTIKWKYSKYLIVPMLLALVLVIFMNEVLMPLYTRHGQAIEVPNLVEMTYEGARMLLNRQDLEIVEKTKKFDVNYRSGIIISQNPKAYTEVKEGRRIYVIVSKGEPTIEMPQLVGMSKNNAIFEITQLDINVRHITYEHSSAFHDDRVIDQSIPFGEYVKVGQSVDLIVSLGRFPDEFIVPHLVGRSLVDAKKVIKQQGFTLGLVSYQLEDELLPETVIDQSLKAYSIVSQGDTLNLLISRLPDESEKGNLND